MASLKRAAAFENAAHIHRIREDTIKQNTDLELTQMPWQRTQKTGGCGGTTRNTQSGLRTSRSNWAISCSTTVVSWDGVAQ